MLVFKLVCERGFLNDGFSRAIRPAAETQTRAKSIRSGLGEQLTAVIC